MLNDKPNVMNELAPKGSWSVEIIEIINWPDIPRGIPFSAQSFQTYFSICFLDMI